MINIRFPWVMRLPVVVVVVVGGATKFNVSSRGRLSKITFFFFLGDSPLPNPSL